MPSHHAINYIEIGVADVAVAKTFYGDAFGWTFTDYGPEYAGILSPEGGDREVGGLNGQGVRPRGGPLVLLWSADLDASAEAVAAAGGEVNEGPYEFPGGRRFHFIDPAGNELGVWGA
ncbi:VOC family protein [Demetria terragena]|uniref:VOC family protein n=1 Tax=Demetria terragena TaxID=63959 RepID=UPI000381A360|nr:VOC family protein [Demetria terragena]